MDLRLSDCGTERPEKNGRGDASGEKITRYDVG